MNNYLNNILIPIGKRFEIQEAVKKAMDLAGKREVTIHLVYAMRSCSFLGMLRSTMAHKLLTGNDLNGYLSVLIDLVHWKNFIERKAPGLRVKIHIKRGFSVQPLVAKIAKKEKVGMVISSGYPECKWFSGEENISVIEHRGEANAQMAITLFKTLPRKRKQEGDGSFTAKGIQVRLSYN